MDDLSGTYLDLDVSAAVDASGFKVGAASAGTAPAPLEWAKFTGLVLGCIEAKFCE